MTKCGCSAYDTDARDGYGGPCEIEFCPLHESAGEMRAMLRHLISLDEDDTDNLEGLKASARELLSAIAGGNDRV